MIPTTAINEAEPAGADQIALGDNAVRRYKTQVREILEVNHDFPTSGNSATAGQHKMVTFQEQADIGSGSTGVTQLGGQTIDGKPELVYTDEDDNDIQLTSGGKLHSAVDGLSAGLKQAIFNYMYPVGKVITLGVSTNPNTLYGFGTWTAIAGKVIVGIDATQTEFDTLNETGGAKTVDISHTHTVTGQLDASPGGNAGVAEGGNYDNTLAGTTSSSGSATTSVLQPYQIKYIWERTA